MPTTAKKLEFHPFAAYFPLMGKDALNELAADIAVKGLLDKIWLYEGKILDGRNRYIACLQADVDPRFEEYKGRDALGFSCSKNLPRRHLSESQRAMIAAHIATARKGGQASRMAGSDHSPATTVKAAAKKMKVGATTVKAAKAVQAKGVPELVKAVEDGTLTVGAAAEVAKLPKAEQTEVVTGTPDEVKKKAAEARPAQTRPMPHETKTGRNKPPARGLGGEAFTFALIEKHYGALVRATYGMADAYKAKDSKSHDTANEKLEDLIKHLKAWYNRLQKKDAE